MPCTMGDDYSRGSSAADQREIESLKNQVKELQKTLKSKSTPPVTKIIENPEKDQIIHEMSVDIDYLRDLIYRMFWSGGSWDYLSEEIEAVLDKQTKHRQDDLDRLTVVFAKDVKTHRERLMKVLFADPTEPLEPQLGFNPDDF